jgi:hypothetical protein
VDCGEEKKLTIRASAGGGGRGGGGWLGSRRRFDEVEPDEDEVRDASVCSVISIFVFLFYIKLHRPNT